MSEAYKDPYKILGVTPDATDDDIKKAYRDLARKYHPDRYVDSELKTEAENKMKEVNAAYEEIQDIRSGKKAYGQTESNGYGGYGGYGKYNSQSQTGSRFYNVRNNINAGNIDAAEQELGSTHEGDRTAEWYFLMGCVLIKRGKYVDAGKYLDQACRMDPYNREYRITREQLRRQANGGNASTTTNVGCAPLSLCLSLMCADCVCNCMGGDLCKC